MMTMQIVKEGKALTACNIGGVYYCINSVPHWWSKMLLKCLGDVIPHLEHCTLKLTNIWWLLKKEKDIYLYITSYTCLFGIKSGEFAGHAITPTSLPSRFYHSRTCLISIQDSQNALSRKFDFNQRYNYVGNTDVPEVLWLEVGGEFNAICNYCNDHEHCACSDGTSWLRYFKWLLDEY